jgi:hypothetical protein
VTAAVLTTVGFDVLWERLGLGRTPLVLQLPSPGRTVAEREQICTRAAADPALADPRLAGRFRVLADPDRRYELRAWWGRSVRALAAGRGDDGVLAVRDGERVVVRGDDDVLGSLLAQLPPGRPGSGRAATVPSADLRAAGTGPDLRRGLIDRGVDPAEAGLLARMLGGVRGQAQITAGTDRHLTVLDTGGGRYLVTFTTGADGVGWTTVAPTDVRRIRHRTLQLAEEDDHTVR